MDEEELLYYLQCGREIEFRHNGVEYSITFSPEGQEKCISFCEAHNDPINVNTPEEISELQYNGESVKEMLHSIGKNDIWIY